jgi:hypothetical protein
MSNGPPPACPADAVNNRWLFPQEQAPPSPFEGCLTIGLSHEPAPLTSNDSWPALRPTPSINNRLTAALAKHQQEMARQWDTDMNSSLPNFANRSLLINGNSMLDGLNFVCKLSLSSEALPPCAPNPYAKAR